MKSYIEKVLSLYVIEKVNPVSTPLGAHLQLTALMSHSIDEVKKLMSQVSYANAVWSLMYGVVSTRLDITYAVGGCYPIHGKPQEGTLVGSQVDL